MQMSIHLIPILTSRAPSWNVCKPSWTCRADPSMWNSAQMLSPQPASHWSGTRAREFRLWSSESARGLDAGFSIPFPFHDSSSRGCCLRRVGERSLAIILSAHSMDGRRTNRQVVGARFRRAPKGVRVRVDWVAVDVSGILDIKCVGQGRRARGGAYLRWYAHGTSSNVSECCSL